MRRTVFFALVLMSCVLQPLYAVEIYFKNGDRLSGKVMSIENGTMKVATAVAGEINVKLADVERFANTQVLAIVLEDGTVLREAIALYENGKLHLETAAASAQSAATQPGAPDSAIAGNAGEQRVVPLESVRRVGPSKPSWRGNISAGAIVTQGNTETELYHFGAEALWRGDFSRLELKGDYYQGREEDPNTGDKYLSRDNWVALGKYDYFLARRWYAYANARAEHDSIADLYIRLSPGVGMGYQWVESPRWNFNTEAGASWVYERYKNPTDEDDYVALRLAYHYDRKIGKVTSLVHNFEILPSVEDGEYVLNTDAGVRFAVTNQLFTEFKIVLTYDSQPAPGNDSADVKYIANLGYAF